MPRNSDPTVLFWPGGDFDRDRVREMEANYTQASNILQTQWHQADIDQRFSLGDQDIWAEIFPGLGNLRRKMFNFNITNPMVQMVSGYQRRNRKSSIVIPVHPQGQKTADQLTKVLYHVHGQNKGYNIYSDAFEQGSLVQGFGLMSFFMTTANDPSGDIGMRYVDFKSVIIDPFFRKRDLSDCRYIWTRQYFDRHEAMLLYPDFKDEIERLPRHTSGKDDKFYYMPENWQQTNNDLLAFDEYWYLSTREAEYLVDVYTNETQEFNGDADDKKYIKSQFSERLKFVKKPKQTVRRSLLLNQRVMVDEPNPYGMDRYPYVGFYGYFNPDTPYYAYKFKGMVRDLRDAQYLYNRRKVADLDIIESQQQGIKAKKGALVTPEDGMNTGNGRFLTIDPAFQMDDVQPMEIVPPSPVLLQMEEMLKDVMHRISGVSEELMGSAVDDKAGILSMLRQGAGITTLHGLFDGIDQSQTECGEVIAQMVQKNYSYNKIKDIIGEEPTPEFENKAFFKYNCKVVQGVLTETQQQLELAQLLELQERFGPIFPMEEIVEAMTIQNKDRIVEKMMQRQQQQMQMEQQRAQLEMQQMQVDNEMKLSYAESEKGLAQERFEKAQTEQFVRFAKMKDSEASEKRALYDFVKSIAELDEMETRKLSEKVKALQMINQLDFTESEKMQSGLTDAPKQA